MFLQPQKSFLVEMSINNPSDSVTYFVQVVITNSSDNSTLATLNLGSGNPYWSQAWITPADPSGTGRQITMKKTVYTDSLYTTISPAYGTIYESYILRNVAGGFGQPLGGFSRGLEISEVRREMKKIVDDIKFPEQKESVYDDSRIWGAFQAFRREVGQLHDAHGKSFADVESWISDRIKESHVGLLSMMKSVIDSVAREIRAIPKGTDYAPELSKLADRLESLSSEGVVRHEESKKLMSRPLTVKMPMERAEAEAEEEDESQMTVQRLLALSNDNNG